MADKHVLVFGGTGLIGEHITRALVEAAPQIGKISLFTSENTIWTESEYIDSLKKRGVNIISGDIKSHSDVDEAYTGVDIIVSCVGRAVIDKQIDLIKTDIEYGPSSAYEKQHQDKLRVRAALRRVENLSYAYVITGPYGDGNPGLHLSATKLEWRQLGTFDVAQRAVVLIGDGSTRVSLTTMRDCGNFVAAAVMHLDVARNKALKLNSFSATPSEILQEFERQTCETCAVTLVPLDKLRAVETQAWADGPPMVTAATRRRIWAEGGTLYARRDNHLIGMDSLVDNLQSAVAQAIEVQRQSW